jgi:hypothetical protein
MAAQLAALAELFDSARTHPHTYLTEGGLLARDAIELAERCAAFDAGCGCICLRARFVTRPMKGGCFPSLCRDCGLCSKPGRPGMRRPVLPFTRSRV